MFRNKRVDIRHATWRTAQAVQVLCANFPKSLSWCFPSVLDRQTKLHTYSAIFSFSSPLGVLEHNSFGIYRFKADHSLSMHCVPCVLCPRLRVLRVNSILTGLTWKHFRPRTYLNAETKETGCSVASRASGKWQETCCSVASRASGKWQETCCSVASRASCKWQETCCSIASRAAGKWQERSMPNHPPHPTHPTRFLEKITLSFVHKF